MSKYLAVISNSVKKNLVYRANSFITMISIMLSFVVLFYFWNSIYMQGNRIGTYSLKEMISYYVFFTIFQLLIVGDGIAWSIGEEIKNGQITNIILKPISYLKYKLSQSFGNLAYRMIIFLPVIFSVLYFLRAYLVFAQGFEIYLVFSICAIISYVLYFLIYFLIGIIAFWTSDSKGFFWACWVIINFMQGGLIPLDLFPRWFLLLSDFLPFKYLFFIPVSLLSGRNNFDVKLILIPLAWCLGGYIFAEFLYFKGLKKYEGIGV